MYFRRTVRFIIVFNDDFSVIDRLLRSRTDEIIIIAVVKFTHANVGQHVLGVGNSDGISMDIMANNFAHLAKRFAIDLAKKRQSFVGDIQSQLSLLRGAGFFLAFHALHQHDDKSNADTTKNHWDADLRNDIQPQFGGGRPGDDEDHGQRFAQHSA